MIEVKQAIFEVDFGFLPLPRPVLPSVGRLLTAETPRWAIYLTPPPVTGIPKRKTAAVLAELQRNLGEQVDALDLHFGHGMWLALPLDADMRLVAENLAP